MNEDHILIAGAVSGEVLEIITHIQDPVHTVTGGRKTVSGLLKNRPARVVITGPGIVNCVQALTAAIETSRPGIIIMTGCGGGFEKNGLGIGDIAIASEEIDIHTGIEGNEDPAIVKDLPFCLMEKEGLCIKNRYHMDKALKNIAMKTVTKEFAPHGVTVKTGPFITVSTITASNRRAERLLEQFSPVIEAMEGAGAAHVAIHYNIPFLEIRSVSNLVGTRDLSKWNLPLSFKNAARAVVKLIEAIAPQIL